VQQIILTILISFFYVSMWFKNESFLN